MENQSNNSELEMIELIAANIPENNVTELMEVWHYMKSQERINHFIIKELETAGIPVIEGLAGLLGLNMGETAMLIRMVGIEFSYVETVFKNITSPGAIFNKAQNATTRI